MAASLQGRRVLDYPPRPMSPARPRSRRASAQVELPTPEEIEVEDLRFDPSNPRLASDLGESPSQPEILERLWNDFAVDEIALSIHANSFFKHEPLFVEKTGPHYTVLEGNRRLAAVLLLCNQDLRMKVGATDLPRLTPAQSAALDTLPAIVCRRDEVWRYMGFKHVNGPQAWGAEAKADYIAWVHNHLGIKLDEIAATIGDKHQTVRRLYAARMVLQQAERAKKFQREDRAKNHFSFSHLYTGLGYAGIQKFIGLRNAEADDKDPVPKSRLDNLGDLLLWMYGSKGKNRLPLVRSQNPDLRVLDETLQKEEGIVALRRGLPLDISRDIARGDEQIFRESLQESKLALQRAIGTIITGYDGQPDLLTTARDVRKLSERLVDQMGEVPAGRRSGGRR